MFASDFRRRAREALRGKWLRVVLILMLAGILGAQTGNSGLNFGLQFQGPTIPAATLPADFAGRQIEEAAAPAVRALDSFMASPLFALLSILALAMLFVGPTVSVGAYRAGRAVLDGETPRVRMLFPRGMMFKALAAQLLCGLLVILQFLLLIVPGVIALYRYSMTSYLLATRPELGPMEAIRLSGRRMKGRKGRLFCLEFSFIGWNLLCMLPILVLMIVSVPMIVLQGSMRDTVLPLWMALMLLSALLVTWIGGCFVNAYAFIARTAFFDHADRPRPARAADEGDGANDDPDDPSDRSDTSDFNDYEGYRPYASRSEGE